jgi:DNA repair photolyase
MGELEFNGKAIYSTKGAAREYGRIGCNFYTGCPHECTYCYLKRGAPSKQLGGNVVRLKRAFRNEEHALEVFIREVERHIKQCRRDGIFFSFSTDPLIEETRDLTIAAARYCIEHEIPVWILSKDANFIDACEFHKLVAYTWAAMRLHLLHVGFTLTWRSDMEPNASRNADRVLAMHELYGLGVQTFASIEPVIDWPSARIAIRESRDVCKHYKIGLRSGVKKDYYNPEESVEAVRGIMKDLEGYLCTVYFKESLCQHLAAVMEPEEYNALLRLTVDQDGNPIK